MLGKKQQLLIDTQSATVIMHSLATGLLATVRE